MPPGWGSEGADGNGLPVFAIQQAADQLLTGYRDWRGLPPRAWTLDAARTLTVNVTALPAEAQHLALWALEVWADVTGIAFQQVAGPAQITFVTASRAPSPPSRGRAT